MHGLLEQARQSRSNAHDFEQLETIYGSHFDTSSTIASGLSADENAKPEKVERNDRIADSIITETYRDGSKKITHVFWALETRGRSAEHAFGGDSNRTPAEVVGSRETGAHLRPLRDAARERAEALERLDDDVAVLLDPLETAAHE